MNKVMEIKFLKLYLCPWKYFRIFKGGEIKTKPNSNKFLTENSGMSMEYFGANAKNHIKFKTDLNGFFNIFVKDKSRK